MPYSDDELWEIYRKTNGYCHYCGKKLSWENYGVHGERELGMLTIRIPEWLEVQTTLEI